MSGGGLYFYGPNVSHMVHNIQYNWGLALLEGRFSLSATKRKPSARSKTDVLLVIFWSLFVAVLIVIVATYHGSQQGPFGRLLKSLVFGGLWLTIPLYIFIAKHIVKTEHYKIQLRRRYTSSSKTR